MSIFRIGTLMICLICGCAATPRSQTEAEVRLSYGNNKPHGEVVLRLVR